jgi:hypothetical protein
MEDIFFSGFGIQILKREDYYFLRFDAGEMFVVDEREAPITEEEARQATLSETAARALLEACRKRCKSRSSH